jgi:hypothetical protein
VLHRLPFLDCPSPQALQGVPPIASVAQRNEFGRQLDDFIADSQTDRLVDGHSDPHAMLQRAIHTCDGQRVVPGWSAGGGGRLESAG